MSIVDIHGWSKDQVTALQQQQAESAGCVVEFSDDWSNASLGDDAMEMAFIPAAGYMMGSPVEKEGFENELEHPVSIEKAFAVAKFQVTFTQYDEFARQTGRELPDDAGWGRGKLPVINVSWQDACAFADWVSEKTGQCYRLPTESEWELAARAGTNTQYWWGDEQDHSMANGGMRRRIGMDRRDIHLTEGDNWEDDNIGISEEEGDADRMTDEDRRECGSITSVVGSFPANPFGLYDVLGNVGEWTSSEYRISYDREENRAATVASDEGDRSVRGGWCYLEQGCVRTAFRIGLRVDSRVSYVGFRLLREV